MQITDLYKQLFGRKGPADGNVIDMSEHGRVGGLSTGQPFKYTVPIDPDTGATLTGGAGTQYTEGDTDASITGTAMLWEDAANTLKTVNADAPLPVAIISGAGSGGTASADDADFTAGTTSGTPSMGVYESTPSAVTDGDLGVVGITSDRRLKVYADLSATDNAVLDNIDADLTTVIGHVDGIETLIGTSNSSLATIAGDTTSIDAKIPALGQALAANSVPVILPSATITTLTPQTDALTDTQLRATPVPVSGTVTANLSATDNAVLDNIDADLTTIIGHVDGIETLIGTTNTTLGTIDTDTGNIATSVATIAGAFGTAGVPDTQVLSVQGIASMTPLTVDLGANNDVTVTGTVDLGATDNAVLDAIAADGDAIQTLLGTIDADTGAIKTAVELIDNAISGTEMQVDVVGSLPAGTNAIGKLAANSGVDIGDVDVTSIAAGSNLIGNVGIGVRTSGGATPFYNLDVDETEDAIKASAGQLYELYCNNTTAAQIFVKLYNATTANVTVGTTTPVMVIPVPGNADSDGAGVVRQWPMGLAFDTAITIAATTGAADNDTGAPGAGAIIVSGAYN